MTKPEMGRRPPSGRRAPGQGIARPSRTGRKRALVLFSGGLDSTVALWWARQRGWRVTAMSFEWPGRPAGESRAAARVLATLNGDVDEVLNLSVPGLSAWADLPRRNRAVYASAPPPGYLPARNLVFQSLALAAAEPRGIPCLVAGHTRSDATSFRDARPAFFRAVARAASLGRPASHPAPHILLPLARLDDAGVLRLGRALGAPLHLTWTCYTGGRIPCRRCAACRDRAEAFRAAGLADAPPGDTER